MNANPYTYVLVSKQLPEALTLFENGAPTLVNIPVNTGAPGADTVGRHLPGLRARGELADAGHQPGRLDL